MLHSINIKSLHIQDNRAPSVTVVRLDISTTCSPDIDRYATCSLDTYLDTIYMLTFQLVFNKDSLSVYVISIYP